MPAQSSMLEKLKNGVDVYIQDQTTDRISLFLAQTLGLVVSISGASKDAESFNIVTDGVVPVVGNFICLQENSKITQEEITNVVSVSGDEYTITVSVPLDTSYSSSAGCSVQNVDIGGVNGSVTPIVFKIQPVPNSKWDLNRMMVAMVLSTAGDDGQFGNIATLTNGQYFRKEDGETSQNLFLVKDNSDYRVEGYDVTYTTRSGGLGSYGMAVRITFNGQDKSGVVIRLDGDNSESFTTVVRDDYTSIVKYRIKIQGHVVLD